VGTKGPPAESRHFGMFLRGLREDRRLSLDTVEEMSAGLPERLTKSHLSRIENGRAIPTFPRMFALSQIYGIPVAYLAERFEVSLMHGMFPPPSTTEPVEQVLVEARRLRRAGRHAEELVLYEALLERQRASPDERKSEWTIRVQLERVNCLAKLSRWATAKEECERLLGSTTLTPRQRVIALEIFATTCYKLGKHTVAMMAIDRAEAELASLTEQDEVQRLRATLTVLKGNTQFVTQQFAAAADAFRTSVDAFEKIGNDFEACRARLNLAVALMELGSRSRSRELLEQALRAAENGGYDRQRAYAHGHLGLLGWREGDLDGAEAHCLRSNGIARPREYVSLLWRNCYYLWKIAVSRKDEAATRANERTLKTYLGRVEEYMPEVDEFKSFLGRGNDDD